VIQLDEFSLKSIPRDGGALKESILPSSFHKRKLTGFKSAHPEIHLHYTIIELVLY